MYVHIYTYIYGGIYDVVHVGAEIGHPLRLRTVAMTVAGTS